MDYYKNFVNLMVPYDNVIYYPQGARLAVSRRAIKRRPLKNIKGCWT
eukprot:UN01265